MNNVIKFLLLSPLAFSAVGCSSTHKEPQPVDVIVISGQSNAVGLTRNNYHIDRSGFFVAFATKNR